MRSRSVGLTAADVDNALSARSMLITWLNRGTLHLVCSDDYWWLHPLTTPQLVTGNRRRLAQEGVSEAQADRGVDVVTEAVRAHGPQTRRELRDRLEAAGVPTAGQALVHVLVAASLRSQIVRGPMRRAEHAFVSAADWLGVAPGPLARPEALALLARRYLVGHGPADACGQLRATAETLVAHAQDAGVIRQDVDGDDILRMVNAIALATEEAPDTSAVSERLFTLMVDGLRA